MRITVHLRDNLEEEVRRIAANERRSVSSVVSESVLFYVRQQRRRAAGMKLLDLSGHVGAGAFEEIDNGREGDDRA